MGNAALLIQLASQKHKSNSYGAFYIDNELVSSTKVREYLKDGNIDNAVKLLGYQPTISGKVVEGNKIGRQMGFPTANLEWDKDLLIPGNGVYAVKVIIDNKKYLGVLNIGNKPTVNQKPLLSMEVNILDFSGDIYQKEIEIIFFIKIRNEIKFSNIEQLKNQIAKDIEKSISFFSQTISKAEQ